MSGSRSYSWMPDWLRKFLNLDDEMPNYGPSGGVYNAPEYQAAAPPPARPAVSYTPSAVPATGYTPPAPTWAPSRLDDMNMDSFRRAAPQGEAPDAPQGQTWKVGPPAGAEPGSVPPPPGSMQAAAGEGYVQPIGYMFRAYARGALPPQGLEQFTREFRATLTDVWNFYSYWTRFQTDEVFRIGRVVIDTVVDNLPSGEGAAAPSGRTKRPIKVTSGNGNGSDEKKVKVVPATPAVPAATAATPPATPAAAAPTPPAAPPATPAAAAPTPPAAPPATPAAAAPTPPAAASNKPAAAAPTPPAAASNKPAAPSNKPKDKKG
jgi:hypothetical protein